MKRKIGVQWTFAILAAPAILSAQLSTSAYRVLGQPDLVKNGLNSVTGNELFAPNGVAWSIRDGSTRLYVADTRNNRVLIWDNTGNGQVSPDPAYVLGQPNFTQVNAFGIGLKGFNQPVNVAVDPFSADVFVSDAGNNRILRFRNPFLADATPEPIAVYGQPDFSTRTANSTGIGPRSLRTPRGLAFDATGNLWVADNGNNRILRYPSAVLAPPGGNNAVADLVLGQANMAGALQNRGGAISAQGLDSPVSLAFDNRGNLWVADFDNARVVGYSQPFTNGQAATLLLGQANFTTRSVSPLPNSSSLAGPTGVSVGPQGDIFVSIPLDNRILVFPPNAAPTGGTAPGTAASAAVASNVLGQTGFANNTANAGSAPRPSSLSLSGPSDVKVDTSGRIYVADTNNNRIMVFPPPSRVADALYGQGDFGANGANRVKPNGLTVAYKIVIDYSREPFALYASDTSNHRVLGWIDAARFQNGAPADLVIGQPDGYTALPNYDGRLDGPTQRSLYNPRGLAVDTAGNLYVADSGNHRVLRYSRPFSQQGQVVPDMVIGQTDYTNASTTIVNANSLRTPSGLAMGPDGSLFVADSGNHRVLEFPFASTRAIRVFGQSSFTSNTLPTAANVNAQTLSNPQGLYVDSLFNVYVTDTGSNRVLVYTNTRDETFGQAATRVLGQDSFAGSGPGAGAARLRAPSDVGLDNQGQVYVVDNGNHRVVVFPSLILLPDVSAAATGVFGQPNVNSGLPNFNTQDGQATPEGLVFPVGLLVDRRDTLYVGDSGNNRIVHVLKRAGLVNQANPQAGQSIARGSLASLMGAGLADAAEGVSTPPLPRNLQGREVVFANNTLAPISSVAPNQLNLQIPIGLSTGAQRFLLRAVETAEPLAGGAVNITNVSPALFTQSQDGRGAVLGQDESGTAITPANAAPRGSVVVLFGTGQGLTNPEVPDGEAAPSDAQTIATPTSDGQQCLTNPRTVCVAIGSTFAEVLFSGLNPGVVGTWQLKVKIPNNALTGPAVPLRVVIGGTPSNTVSLAIK